MAPVASVTLTARAGELVVLRADDSVEERLDADEVAQVVVEGGAARPVLVHLADGRRLAFAVGQVDLAALRWLDEHQARRESLELARLRTKCARHRVETGAFYSTGSGTGSESEDVLELSSTQLSSLAAEAAAAADEDAPVAASSCSPRPRSLPCGRSRKRQRASAEELTAGHRHATFFRQAEALERLDALLSLPSERRQRPVAVALEERRTGKRRYMALRWREFCELYLRLPATQRHFYELIREPAPVRLYFDLEYTLSEANTRVDGEALVRTVLSAAAAMLFRLYGLLLEGRHVLQLDSSSSAKFSRHLVVHLPGGRLFRDNRHCGSFCRRLVAEFRQRLLVTLPSGELGTVVDTSVYSRNRLFRLYLSSKFGKTAVLAPAQGCTFAGVDESTPEGVVALLEASLVAPLGGADLIANKPELVLECSSSSSSSDSNSGSSSSSAAMCSLGPPQLQAELPIAGQRRAGFREAGDIGLAPASEWPHVELCVLAHAARAGGSALPPPSVRAWELECGPENERRLLTLHMQRHRFCHRIARAHKSNNVYYVVDLKAGSFVQRCHDPDCRGYVSHKWPLWPGAEQAMLERAPGAAQAAQ
jgi:hypothetical protein